MINYLNKCFFYWVGVLNWELKGICFGFNIVEFISEGFVKGGKKGRSRDIMNREGRIFGYIIFGWSCSCWGCWRREIKEEKDDDCLVIYGGLNWFLCELDIFYKLNLEVY